MVILFRKSLDEEDEFDICKKYNETYEYRSAIPANSLVIGRYSVLPFYEELEKELKIKNSQLINSYNEHLYIANIENWYSDLKGFTPRTWFMWYDLPENKSFVVKGRTNSKKFEWNKMMFCKTRAEVPGVVDKLLNDQLIASQGVCVREFVPLETFSYGINQMPMTNEWRLFFYKNNLLCYGYYWSILDDKLKPKDLDPQGLLFARKMADIISNNTNFFAIDIAKTVDGDWILIEINDGCQSGLSDIDKDLFYKKLSSLFSI